MTTVNAAIIGAGIIGEGHLAGLQSTEGIEVRAIAEPNATLRTKQAAKLNVPVQVDDYHELLNDDGTDVGYVCITISTVRKGLCTWSTRCRVWL